MSKKQPLANAAEIIERFGGIRPMAAKIDTPVTTVQGWKKRDVIPGTRRTQILEAATKNNIDVSDLTSGNVVVSAPSKAKKKAAKPKKSSNKSASKAKATKNAKTASKNKVDSIVTETSESNDASSFVANKPARDEAKIAEKEENYKKILSSVPPVSIIETETSKEEGVTRMSEHDRLLSEMQNNSKKAIAASTWIATGLILLAAAAAFLLLWPNFKKSQDQIETQNQQLVTLENEVEVVREQQEQAQQDVGQRKFLGASLPDNMQERFDELQNQARNISVTVDQLSQKAKDISAEAIGGSALAISQRLDMLEEKVEGLSGPEGSFSGLVERLRNLEGSVMGQTQLESSANQLRGIVGNNGDAINDDLAAAQGTEQGALGKTLDGVSGDNLKAAAILIAFSQFRSSLDREAPFEEDLVLLQNLVGEDNPALQSELNRLSVHADGGILTAAGLSGELKKMTGDIVVSSLKGEDVSVKEKMKARFGDIVQIEKDGEMVSGTETQVTVAKAQDFIEQGRIEDSIVALEGLDGEAAVAAQPFIAKARATLASERVKAMLNESILSKVNGDSLSLDSIKVPNMENMTFDKMKNAVRDNVPGLGQNEVVRDEDSGVTILPPSTNYRGFTGN